MLVKCFLYMTGNHDRHFMGGAGAFARTCFAAYKLGIKKDAFTSLVVWQVNQRQYFYYIKHGIGQGNKQFWAVEETLLKHFILEGGSLRLSKFTSLTKFLKLTRTKGSFLPQKYRNRKVRRVPSSSCLQTIQRNQELQILWVISHTGVES